jgi:hypothetical protein
MWRTGSKKTEGTLGLVPNLSIGCGAFAFAFLVNGAHVGSGAGVAIAFLVDSAHVLLIHNFAVIFQNIRTSGWHRLGSWSKSSAFAVAAALPSGGTVLTMYVGAIVP